MNEAEMKAVGTFTATIYVGQRIHRTDTFVTLSRARAWLQEYVDSVGLCVSLTNTEFLYSNGSEPGFIVGLINYPRFPAEFQDIRSKALHIAENLRRIMKQYKVTVVFPDVTVMVSEEETPNGKCLGGDAITGCGGIIGATCPTCKTNEQEASA